MKNKGFVIMMFSLVLAVLTTGGVYAQFEDAIEQDDPFDIFLDAYLRRLEKGQITTLGGEYVQYVVDYNSFYWTEDNTALSVNVKRMMARHYYNVSLTHYQNQDGSTTFAINHLNAGGKYEFFAFMAYKQ
jgi:hypothetical protein